MAKGNKKPMIDLHGLQADEVFDALESFFAKHSSKNPLFIMTGKGKGIVKAKVIEYLKLAKYPWTFDTDDRGQKNEGVIKVHTD